MLAPVSPDALLDADPDVFALSSESPPHAATSADTATTATMPSHVGFVVLMILPLLLVGPAQRCER
jgi:hypothetical protein